jgi:hypothetical protein
MKEQRKEEEKREKRNVGGIHVREVFKRPRRGRNSSDEKRNERKVAV